MKAVSEKQEAFVNNLLEQRVHNYGEAYVAAHMVSGAKASVLIDKLLACPRKQTKPKFPEPVSGIYAVEGTIYKVYKAQSGRMLAKRLIVHSNKTADFVYAGLAVRFVKGNAPMTLEQAKEFGAIYGVCCKCSKTLTDENSIAAGIGPVCASKGW